jgi:hypothetical protein
MYTKPHLIYAILFCLILLPFINWWILILFSAAFFIDVDHYFYYIIKFKDLSLKKAYRYFINNPELKDLIFPFHTIEFYLLLLILATFNIFFVFILLGVSFHLILDIIEIITHPQDIGKKSLSLYGWINRH